MNTRCKPGDLAMIVKVTQTHEAIGRLVIIERELSDGEVVSGRRTAFKKGVAWVVTPASSGHELPWCLSDGNMIYVAEAPLYDYQLRPIRPNEGEDESLSWAEKPPSKIKQPA